MKANLPGAVRCVPLQQVQRYYRRPERFMQLHLQEATLGVDLPGEVRAFAMKKYKRHRGVPASLLSDLQSALEGKHGKLTERKRKGQGKPEAVQAKITRVTGAPREINPMFNGDLRKLLNIFKLYSPSMFAVAQK